MAVIMLNCRFATNWSDVYDAMERSVKGQRQF